ncbi:hypothetical protein AK812_SmicGene7727 [Symbiodinium microadriaticum]|uniref:Uncharacterized protein n=1 Tax=Symbiodinium microadriaticum TaxID=2951 RepID=A0A1Q9EMR0_SYMMI|nr:hypothetical protein AK812_SmicGene7727 [Symbiodinium microadriaticum]
MGIYTSGEKKGQTIVSQSCTFGHFVATLLLPRPQIGRTKADEKSRLFAKARRGLYHGDARPVLHDCFCGINKDFAESTIEAKKVRKSQAPAGPPVPETPRKAMQREVRFRCVCAGDQISMAVEKEDNAFFERRALSHGGSFRRVDQHLEQNA